MNIRNTRKGFTLVEVLVVVSIISFLSSIATVSFGTARVRAQDAATLQVAVSTRSAVLASEADGNAPPGVPGAFITESTDPSSDWVKTWSPLANAGYGGIPYSKNGKLMFMYNYQGKEVVLGFFQNNNNDSGNSCDFFVNGGTNTNSGDNSGNNSGNNSGTSGQNNSSNNGNESSSRADTKSQVAAVAGVKLAQTGPDGSTSNPDNPDNPNNGDSGDPSCIQITPTIKFCPNVTGTNGSTSGTYGSNHNIVNPKDPLDPNGGDNGDNQGNDDPFKDAVCLKF